MVAHAICAPVLMAQVSGFQIVVQLVRIAQEALATVIMAYTTNALYLPVCNNLKLPITLSHQSLFF